jgi:hypothetical protein
MGQSGGGSDQNADSNVKSKDCVQKRRLEPRKMWLLKKFPVNPHFNLSYKSSVQSLLKVGEG